MSLASSMTASNTSIGACIGLSVKKLGVGKSWIAGRSGLRWEWEGRSGWRDEGSVSCSQSNYPTQWTLTHRSGKPRLQLLQPSLGKNEPAARPVWLFRLAAVTINGAVAENPHRLEGWQVERYILACGRGSSGSVASVIARAARHERWYTRSIISSKVSEYTVPLPRLAHGPERVQDGVDAEEVADAGVSARRATPGGGGSTGLLWRK